MILAAWAQWLELEALDYEVADHLGRGPQAEAVAGRPARTWPIARGGYARQRVTSRCECRRLGIVISLANQR